MDTGSSSRTAVFGTRESFATSDLAINILADDLHLSDENDACLYHSDIHEPVAVNIPPPQKGLKISLHLNSLAVITCRSCGIDL